MALLIDMPASALRRDQLGTIPLDDGTVLVEFSDEEAGAYAISPCCRADLLTLRDIPQAA